MSIVYYVIDIAAARSYNPNKFWTHRFVLATRNNSGTGVITIQIIMATKTKFYTEINFNNDPHEVLRPLSPETGESIPCQWHERRRWWHGNLHESP